MGLPWGQYIKDLLVSTFVAKLKSSSFEVILPAFMADLQDILWRISSIFCTKGWHVTFRVSAISLIKEVIFSPSNIEGTERTITVFTPKSSTVNPKRDRVSVFEIIASNSSDTRVTLTGVSNSWLWISSPFFSYSKFIRSWAACLSIK